MRKLISVLGGLVLLCAAGRAEAAPVLGAQLIYTGGDVTITTLPVTSGFTSELGLYDSTFTRLAFLTDDEPAGTVVTFNPGLDYGISIGAELIFGIRVISDSDREYFLGPASRNPDGFIHGAIDTASGVVVGFEDLFGLDADFDYDDNKFRFEGGIAPSVPEPAMFGLLGLGLVGLGLTRRRTS